METFPESTFDIVGHTDNIGSKDKNMTLSADRANAVKNFLVEKGIAESRMTTQGLGDTKPVASNKTPEGRAQNRRIEFIRTDIK
jgi:outer membrane protein OmpA-like peptidoglycan-associated protein